MPKKLDILLEGNPILRQVAADVELEDISFPPLQELMDDMIETCRQSAAVGLAAPQVGGPGRIIVIASKPTKAYPDAPVMEPMILINPEIFFLSKEMEKGYEGCASIPGKRAIVPRHKSVKVSFYDRRGERFEKHLEGFPARIFQHENDHLNGVLFTDRAKPETIVSEAKYLEIIAGKEKA